MKQNKKKDMKPYQMWEKPQHQNPLFLPLIWGGSYLFTRKNKLTVNRIGVKELKPPYLVLSMHQGFMDYYITPLSLFPHRASYISDMEGFANYGNWLYRQIGCIGTRRFVSDPVLISNIHHVINENKDIIVVYPEARHSNAGTNSRLPLSIGKLIKLLKVPVVIQKLKGSYLSQPIWDEKHKRKVPASATLEKILDTADIEQMDVVQLTELVNRNFQYDEYRWQYENRIKIDEPKRAEGLHKILYLCPHCGSEEDMYSHGHTLTCGACGKSWAMNEYGRMIAEEGITEFPHIPDWYEYQRERVTKEIRQGQYQLKRMVTIEALPNEKGFVKLGKGTLEHQANGFTLHFHDNGSVLKFPAKSMHSLHTEYNYRDKGDCIVLSTRGCCYYLYNKTENIHVTKTHLAVEVLYELSITDVFSKSLEEAAAAKLS